MAKRKTNGEAEPGDNGPPVLTATQRAEYYAALTSLKTKRQRVNDEFRALHEEYEKLGATEFDKKAVERMYQAANKDKAKIKAQHDADVMMAIATGNLTLADVDWSQSVIQGDMLEPSKEAAEKMARATAYSEGRKAAADGWVRSSNRYKAGTAQYQGWDAGWRAGADDRKNAGMAAPDRMRKPKNAQEALESGQERVSGTPSEGLPEPPPLPN